MLVLRKYKGLESVTHRSGKGQGIGAFNDADMRDYMQNERDTAIVQWWLTKLDVHGNPTLVDGAHRDRAAVEQAAYLLGRLGLSKGAKYACARVEITDVEAKSHGSNEDAVNILNSIGLKP